MDLAEVTPDLNLYDRDWPVWTYQEQIPPAKFVFDDPNRRGAAYDSIVSGGCIVSGSEVKRSLLFTNVRVHNHSHIEDSVILPGCEIGEAVRLADQLRGALPDGLTCSIGVAEWTPGEPVDQLLERADRALYAANGGGRNRTVAAPPAVAPAVS